jgi:hypothetical protein
MHVPITSTRSNYKVIYDVPWRMELTGIIFMLMKYNPYCQNLCYVAFWKYK